MGRANFWLIPFSVRYFSICAAVLKPPPGCIFDESIQMQLLLIKVSSNYPIYKFNFKFLLSVYNWYIKWKIIPKQSFIKCWHKTNIVTGFLSLNNDPDWVNTLYWTREITLFLEPSTRRGWGRRSRRGNSKRLYLYDSIKRLLQSGRTAELL